MVVTRDRIASFASSSATGATAVFVVANDDDDDDEAPTDPIPRVPIDLRID
jgi:hypothetical protein